ncbi:protein FAM200B-like [Hydra vulgaris]|uniref:Protein FAM200B-like n=1 Tax=Hydra vulgaris TaxID=6087 RepID=A0ABM4B9N0_HYDVU
MVDCKSGLQARVKEIAPNLVGVHYFIHRNALAIKTLPVNLKIVFNQFVNAMAGNFFGRFFKLRNEEKEFLCQMKSGLIEYFELKNFEVTTAYLGDIVGYFNKLNLQLQGKNAIIITHLDKQKTFIEKLKLLNLINEFANYFPDMNLLSSEVIISPFSCDVKNVKEEAQEEFLKLKNGTAAKDYFKEDH